MPETAADYSARIREQPAADGRLPLPEGGIPYWDVFPFEADGLRLKPVDPPLARDPDRMGEDPATCRCARPALMSQLRGTCTALWDDFLPPAPQDILDANVANVAFVVERLAGSHGEGRHRG